LYITDSLLPCRWHQTSRRVLSLRPCKTSGGSGTWTWRHTAWYEWLGHTIV